MLVLMYFRLLPIVSIPLPLQISCNSFLFRLQLFVFLQCYITGGNGVGGKGGMMTNAPN